MILFLYNLALGLGLLVSSPWWLWRMATTRKYREGFLERVGFTKRLAASEDKPVIWIHAVSVGEVLAVSRLVQELNEQLPGYFIAVSTTTRTGQALAQARFGLERVFYSPLDLPWAVRGRFLSLQPKMLVLAETEFWPNLLSESFRRGVPVVVANARISDRSWPRYYRLRSLWKIFLSRLTRVLAQTELDADRLISLGCEPTRVTVSGNLKFDVRVSQEAEATRILRKLAGDLHLIVAGSTLEGEEEALLALWPQLLATQPNLAMILAPRHPERFSAVAERLAKSGIPWSRRSEFGTTPLASGEVVLLDTIGELASVYSLASVAFVGGSLVRAGGHNPLEPAQFGVPIVMGSHYQNFLGIVETMIAGDAVRIAEPDQLGAALSELLGATEDAQTLGLRGKAIFDAEAGATERTVSAIREVLSEAGN